MIREEMRAMTRLVGDVMEPEAISIGPDVAFKDVARLMFERRLSALPVVDDAERVLGVVSEADLIVRDETFGRPYLLEGRQARASRRKAHAAVVRDLMTAPAVVIGPEANLAEAAGLMRRHRAKILPVCDPNGRLLGVVSRLDLVREFLRDDAEIVEEVIDVLQQEMSIPPSAIRATVDDGIVTLEGQVERRSQVPSIIDRVRRIAGTVEVVTRLNWIEDDTLLEFGPLPRVGW